MQTCAHMRSTKGPNASHLKSYFDVKSARQPGPPATNTVKKCGILLVSATLAFCVTHLTDGRGCQPGRPVSERTRRDLLPPLQLRNGRVRGGETLPVEVHTTRHLLKYDQAPAPPFFFLWRQLIPTCTQRLGSAEWPKWQQSSWPWRLRPAEWSSLCPHGHRGLAEMGCF